MILYISSHKESINYSVRYDFRLGEELLHKDIYSGILIGLKLRIYGPAGGSIHVENDDLGRWWFPRKGMLKNIDDAAFTRWLVELFRREVDYEPDVILTPHDGCECELGESA